MKDPVGRCARDAVDLAERSPKTRLRGIACGWVHPGPRPPHPLRIELLLGPEIGEVRRNVPGQRVVEPREVRMIERVEHLKAQLQAALIVSNSDLEVLEN